MTTISNRTTFCGRGKGEYVFALYFVAVGGRESTIISWFHLEYLFRYLRMSKERFDYLLAEVCLVMYMPALALEVVIL